MKTAVLDLESFCATCAERAKSRERAEAAEKELVELWSIVGGAERFLPGYRHGKNLYESFTILVATLVGTHDAADLLYRAIETLCGRCFAPQAADTWCANCSLAPFSRRVRREAQTVAYPRISGPPSRSSVPNRPSAGRLRKWEKVQLTNSASWQRRDARTGRIVVRLADTLGVWRGLMDNALEKQGYTLDGSFVTHENEKAMGLYDPSETHSLPRVQPETAPDGVVPPVGSSFASTPCRTPALCPKCGGEKQIRLDRIPGEAEPRIVPCWICDGKGILWSPS